jgi:CRISPR-associated exonuclease Cas4
MPLQIIKTYKMKYGKEKHQRTERLEKRRTLQRYGLENGEKIYSLSLISERLGVKGKLDLLVIKAKEYVPIELKYSNREPGLHHKYQLAAYVLLLVEEYNTSIRRGIIHLIPKKESFEVEITPSLRKKTKEIIGEIRDLVKEERMPEPVRQRGKCKDCEYQNFCGDV